MVMHCPMVYGDDGADWLQASEPLQNPYFGASMLKCGDITKKVSEMEAAGSGSNGVEVDADTAAALITDYLKLQSALASDDLASAKEVLKDMMATTGHAGALPELLHDMLAADQLEALRKPHFETLSNAFIAAAKRAPETMPENLMIMHCPMVYDDRGADWLQTTEPLLNPYFGAMMLKCGEIKEHIGDEASEHSGHQH